MNVVLREKSGQNDILDEYVLRGGEWRAQGDSGGVEDALSHIPNHCLVFAIAMVIIMVIIVLIIRVIIILIIMITLMMMMGVVATCLCLQKNDW